MGFPQIVPLLGGQFGLQGQVGHADDRIHRRPNFMAHPGEKVTFSPVGGFGSLLGDMEVGLVIFQLGDIVIGADDL